MLQVNSDQKFFKRKKSMMRNELVKRKQLEKTLQKVLVGKFHFFPTFNPQIFSGSQFESKSREVKTYPKKIKKKELVPVEKVFSKLLII